MAQITAQIVLFGTLMHTRRAARIILFETEKIQFSKLHFNFFDLVTY